MRETLSNWRAAWSDAALKIADRATRTFLYAYLAVWWVGGSEYDEILSQESFEAGVVALVLSVAVSLGVTAKNKQGPGVV